MFNHVQSSPNHKHKRLSLCEYGQAVVYSIRSLHKLIETICRKRKATLLTLDSLNLRPVLPVPLFNY